MRQTAILLLVAGLATPAVAAQPPTHFSRENDFEPILDRYVECMQGCTLLPDVLSFWICANTCGAVLVSEYFAKTLFWAPVFVPDHFVSGGGTLDDGGVVYLLPRYQPSPTYELDLRTGRYDPTLQTLLSGLGNVERLQYFYVRLSDFQAAPDLGSMPWVPIGDGIFNPLTDTWDLPWELDTNTLVNDGYAVRADFTDSELGILQTVAIVRVDDQRFIPTLSTFGLSAIAILLVLVALRAMRRSQ